MAKTLYQDTSHRGYFDLVKNELRNAVAHPVSSDPATPVDGQFWYRTDLDEFRVQINGAAVALGAGYTEEQIEDFAAALLTGGSHTGITATYVDASDRVDLVVSAEFISDTVGAMVTGNTETGIAVTYDDADNTLDFVLGALNTLPAPAADLSLAGFKITSLGTPTASTDAATKAYVDSAAAGIDWKASVRAATTGAGTLASSFENGDAIDGVTLATGDRILIKDQAAGAENGIYTVNASGAPTRATDADVSAEVTAGLAVFVEAGTANADTGWLLTTDGAITLGTTALVFTQFTSLGQVTAGSGLSKTGSTLDVNVGAGIEISSDAVRIAAAAAGAGLTGGAGSALAVGAGTGITVNADDVAVDTAVVVRKFVGALTGGATSEVVTHNLGTRDVRVTVRNNATPWDEVDVESEATTTNTVTVKSPVNLPASYRVMVFG